MIRELTAEGRFESGLDALVAGKRYAFLAIVGDRHPARLGAAVENEPGYYPIPEAWAHADSMLEMQKHADFLNARLGLSTKDAGKLVASTFAAGRVDRPQPDAAALRRRATRRAKAARPNETLQHILRKPPPRGAIIRFTDGRPRPRNHDDRPKWRALNDSGVLVSIRKDSGEIVLRVGPPEGPGVDTRYETFDHASTLTFSVERIPVPGEMIDIDMLPTPRRTRQRGVQRIPARPSQSPP